MAKKVAIQYCLDCGKQISLGSKRCKSCFHKSTRGRTPHNKGKRTAFVVCIDCGKKSYHQGKIWNYNGGVKKKWLRCRECNNKYMSENPPNPDGAKPMFGKENPNYGKQGEGVTNWKGGITFNVQGYKKIRKVDHPRNDNGYVLEHRLVMEKHLGRFLEDNEHVHHIDGDKLNNSIGNLLLVDNSEHMKIHWKEWKRL